MGELLNLRQARKAQRRKNADRTAENNRHAFGRTKAEQELTASIQRLSDQRLDGHLRDDIA